MRKAETRRSPIHVTGESMVRYLQNQLESRVEGSGMDCLSGTWIGGEDESGGGNTGG